MTTHEPCPACFGAGRTLIHNPDHQLPDIVRCHFCTGTGLIACAACLDTGEVWSPDDHGHYEFDGYCACPEGRSQAKKNHLVIHVAAATDQPFA